MKDLEYVEKHKHLLHPGSRAQLEEVLEGRDPTGGVIENAKALIVDMSRREIDSALEQMEKVRTA